MNSKQSPVARYGTGLVECLHIPTPLQVLAPCTAASIHAAFRAWLVVTGSGLGSKLINLSCSADATKEANWRTLVLMGDTLKANDAAWLEEAAVLKEARAAGHVTQRTAGFRLRCGNHQLALVRKTAVLSISQFWPTLVRLGHLFETHAFNSSFAGAMIALLEEEGRFQRCLAGVVT